jgi:para-nitrobenzyl esterase
LKIREFGRSLFTEGSMFAHCLGDSGLIRRIILLSGCGALLAGISLTVSHAASGKESGGPVVRVTGGKVQGQLLPAPGGAVFKGIPYAASPIGDLRWREPQPVKAWQGVRSASEYGADCASYTLEVPAGMALPWPATHPPALVETAQKRGNSEDCLFLNIWTPEWPSKTKKAVIVYIHGAEFVGGTGALPEGPAPEAASSLARHGVVLVTINFRANLLGLMGHPELTAESPHHASGNYAILDAIAALRWVHDNIARFGGDPGNVTVLGQSGGAHITSFLTTAPLAKGLIKRAIIQSGAVAQYKDGTTPGLERLEQSGVLTAKALNAPSTDSIKYLRRLPASDITATARKIRATPGNANFYDEGIDGYAIPESPAEVYRSHREEPIPILIGNNAQDSNRVEGVPSLSPKASPEEVRAWMKKTLKVFYGKYPDLLEQAEKIYGLSDAPNEVSTDPAYGPIQLQLGVDLDQRCAVVATALWHSTVAPTYVYEFSRSSPGYAPVHAAELRAVFGYSSTAELADGSGHKLDDVLQQYWANFAKTGDPNGPGLPEWPKYDAAAKKSIDFTNDGPIQRTADHAVACAPYVDKLDRLPKPLYGGAGE